MAETIQVSPEERRFLRRFFLIQALPWMLVMGAVAIGAGRWSAPVAGGAALEARLAEATTALDALRAENAALRSALDAEAKRMQSALDRRVGPVEGRVAAVEKRAGGGAGRELEARVARLEARGGAAEAGASLDRTTLARLHELEARISGLEGPGAGPVPAAPAP